MEMALFDYVDTIWSSITSCMSWTSWRMRMSVRSMFGVRKPKFLNHILMKIHRLTASRFNATFCDRQTDTADRKIEILMAAERRIDGTRGLSPGWHGVETEDQTSPAVERQLQYDNVHDAHHYSRLDLRQKRIHTIPHVTR